MSRSSCWLTANSQQLIASALLLGAWGIGTLSSLARDADPNSPVTAGSRPAASGPAANVLTDSQPSKPSLALRASEGRVVTLQPGVRIDYRQRQVEVDAKVTLREGLLELFACSPRTREYESIICVQARPLIVYQALGLLGLRPGHPLRVRPDGKIEPAEGEPVDVEVRYEQVGIPKRVPIEDWMLLAQTNAPLERQSWVFAGSYAIENGAIAADEEGTVVAVVDFESAIIAPPALHTSSNEDLWLKPNTAAIPPVGTPCTLIIRPGLWRLRLDEAGRLYLGGNPVTFGETLRRLTEAVREDLSTRVEIQVSPDCPASDRRQLQDLLEQLGIKPIERAISRPSAGPSAHSQPADTGDGHVLGWLAGTLTTTRPTDSKTTGPSR